MRWNVVHHMMHYFLAHFGLIEINYLPWLTCFAFRQWCRMDNKRIVHHFRNLPRWPSSIIYSILSLPAPRPSSPMLRANWQRQPPLMLTHRAPRPQLVAKVMSGSTAPRSQNLWSVLRASSSGSNCELRAEPSPTTRSFRNSSPTSLRTSSSPTTSAPATCAVSI